MTSDQQPRPIPSPRRARRLRAAGALLLALAALACAGPADDDARDAAPAAPTAAATAVRELERFGAGPPSPEPRRFGAIPQLTVCGGLAFAGQPSLDDLAAARRAGLVTVVDLRHPRETEFDEAAAARELGLIYLNPAWGSPEELTDEIFDSVREHLRDAPRPLLLHCGSANRVGANWLAYRVLDEGVDWDTALAEARRVGLRTEAFVERAREYVARERARAAGTATDR